MILYMLLFSYSQPVLFIETWLYHFPCGNIFVDSEFWVLHFLHFFYFFMERHLNWVLDGLDWDLDPCFWLWYVGLIWLFIHNRTSILEWWVVRLDLRIELNKICLKEIGLHDQNSSIIFMFNNQCNWKDLGNHWKNQHTCTFNKSWLSQEKSKFNLIAGHASL